MIKNRKELLNHLPSPQQKRRRVLLDIADYVLENCSPEKFLRPHFNRFNFSKYEKILVISIGKASAEMVKAIKPLIKRNKATILQADTGHPLPTLEGYKKSIRIMKAAESLTKNDLAIVLISGGGSAMFTVPAQGVALKDKISLTKKLLKSGASIQDINTVRKHLSKVKGGGLAKLLYPAKVMAYVISDVVENDLSTIASGPISPDKTTLKNALGILNKYNIRIPGKFSALSETLKPGSKYFKNVTVKIVADHYTVVNFAETKAALLNIPHISAKKLVTGEAKEAAKTLLKKCSANNILIASGETTVTCKGTGFGGRNQEFALSALQYLKRNQTILSIGTDGIDGICPEPVAGAIADSNTLELAKRRKMNIKQYLSDNDSFSFFRKTNGLIKTGATGTNLGDLILILQSI